MLRIISFVDPATSQELILPVTPPRYSWNGPADLQVVTLDQLGEATLFGGVKMGDGTLEDVLLPAQEYPFIVPGGRVDPEGILSTLEAWRDASTSRDDQTGAATAKTYTVQSGDCLWTIAEKYYGSGSAYKRLAAANPFIKNPNLIYPGQVLTIPPGEDLPSAAPDSASMALADNIIWDGSAFTAA